MLALTIRNTLRGALLAALGLTCACGASKDEPGLELAKTAEDLSCANRIPESLTVPRENHLAFVLEGRGVQSYACKAATDGAYAWTFVEPEAKLYGKFGKLAGHHYAGPTWEANDGSTVVGAKLASETVDAGAIPWLLLRAASHTGRGRMSNVTFVQRLETVGGLAPTGGCDAARLGASVDVDYAALYAFYR
ncbi:MAG: hypothetical protein JWN04_410 [Myxococcaceae bacterium]|nr:hypothetical protein [Myxococcaceae bacterium]